MDTNIEAKLRMGDEASLAKPPVKKLVTELDPKDFKTFWTVHYKAVHNVDFKIFLGPDDKESAITLGHIFCSKRNWRFIQVRPFLTDIMEDPQSDEERARFTVAKN